MNDTRYGLTAGVYTRDEARAAKLLGAGQRRQRLLELLRPRQPAPAVVGPRRLRRRRDAVDLRHPGLHAAARLAPALGLSADVSTPAAAPRLALFDLDGTLLAGDTDVLWCDFLIDEGVLDRETFAAANRDIADRYGRGEITPAEFAAFYAATLAGRSPEQWSPLRDALRRELDRAAHRCRLLRSGRTPPRTVATAWC